MRIAFFIIIAMTVVWFTSALANDDAQRARALNMQSIELLYRGYIMEAIYGFQEAIKLLPNYAEPYFNLGIALLAKEPDSLELPIACFRQAIALNCQYAPAYDLLGRLLLQKGELEPAIQAFMKATQLDPKHGDAFYHLAISLLQRNQKNDVTEAIKAMDRAIQIKPDDVTFLMSYGNLLLNHQPEKAAILFHRVADLQPEDPTPCLSWAMALEKQKNWEKAIDAYKEALRRRPPEKMIKPLKQKLDQLRWLVRPYVPSAGVSWKYLGGTGLLNEGTAANNLYAGANTQWRETAFQKLLSKSTSLEFCLQNMKTDLCMFDKPIGRFESAGIMANCCLAKRLLYLGIGYLFNNNLVLEDGSAVAVSNCLAYQFGFGGQLNLLASRVFLDLDIRFLGAKPNFRVSDEEKQIHNIKFDLACVAIGAGLSFRF